MTDYRYHCSDCGKTSIGRQIPGGMTCNCAPPKTVHGSPYASAVPIPAALRAEVSNKEAG